MITFQTLVLYPSSYIDHISSWVLRTDAISFLSENAILRKSRLKILPVLDNVFDDFSCLMCKKFDRVIRVGVVLSIYEEILVWIHKIYDISFSKLTTSVRKPDVSCAPIGYVQAWVLCISSYAGS